MCRHVCPVTRVTANESTSPHGWALTIAAVARGQLAWDATTVDLLYRCADCGLCQAWCRTDRPLPAAIQAARAAVVAAGRAPGEVHQLQQRLREWGNPFAPVTAPPPQAAPVALFVGAAAWIYAHEELRAAQRLLAAAGIEVTLVGCGRSSGYLAATLGLRDVAQALAQQTCAELAHTGSHLVLTLTPGQASMLTDGYARLGQALPSGVEVRELPELLWSLVQQGRLALRAQALELAYHDPCHTPRRAARSTILRQLVGATTTRPLRELFWHGARAAPCGASGGLPWTQPTLAAHLAAAVIADAQARQVNVLVTDAPPCLVHLRQHAAADMRVQGLYTLLADHLEE